MIRYSRPKLSVLYTLYQSKLLENHTPAQQHIPVLRCATNADCRLADWQVNEENLVVECFDRVPIPKF